MSNINSDLNSIKGLKTINKMIVDANKEVQSQRIKLQKINKQIVATQKKLESSAHPIFGSLFKEHGELSQFAHQINAFACIYTSNIANLLLYDMNHHFKAKIGKMSHDYALANLSTKN